MKWLAKIFKPKPVITKDNFWDTDLEEIDRQFLPKGKKITDLPIVMHIDGIEIK